MAYIVTRFPRVSEHWGIHDRQNGRWCPVPAGEAAAIRVCERLNGGEKEPPLPWIEVPADQHGATDSRSYRGAG